jgi:hypothetical protein
MIRRIVHFTALTNHKPLCTTIGDSCRRLNGVLLVIARWFIRQNSLTVLATAVTFPAPSYPQPEIRFVVRYHALPCGVSAVSVCSVVDATHRFP